MKNYYEILEVHPKASKEIIEKAYIVLKGKYNVTNDNDLETLNELKEAFEILTNDFLRNQYDAELIRENEEKQNRFAGSEKKVTPKKKTESSKKKSFIDNFKNTKDKKEIKNTKNNVGTIGGLADIVKNLANIRKNIKMEKRTKEDEKKDKLALIIAIVAVILICVVLWFIPFTNQFIRDITVDSPMFSWIFN